MTLKMKESSGHDWHSRGQAHGARVQVEMVVAVEMDLSEMEMKMAGVHEEVKM